MEEYHKTIWEDKIVQFPNRYKDQNGNTLILNPDFGETVQDGTLVEAEKMNNIEKGISFLYDSRNPATNVTHTNYPNNQENIPTLSFLSFWNGSYGESGNSNLMYCKGGQIVPDTRTIAGVDLKDNITASELITAVKANLVNLIYPVGSIYISTTSTSPATLFGGTWEEIQGRFLLGRDSSHAAGITGGSNTTGSHILTVDEIPNHIHKTTVNAVGGMPYYFSAVSAAQGSCFSYKENKEFSSTETGGGKGHTHGQNLPPYLSVYIWKRKA